VREAPEELEAFVDLGAAELAAVGAPDGAARLRAVQLDRLLKLTRPEIDERYREFERLTRFESL